MIERQRPSWVCALSTGSGPNAVGGAAGVTAVVGYLVSLCPMRSQLTGFRFVLKGELGERVGPWWWYGGGARVPQACPRSRSVLLEHVDAEDSYTRNGVL